MSIEEKYQVFRENYFKMASTFVENHLKEYPSIAAILLSDKAPMNEKYWLNEEMKKAIEIEDYEYCVELRDKILNLG